MKSAVSVGKLRILDELHSEAVSFGADFTSERVAGVGGEEFRSEHAEILPQNAGG